MAVPANNANSNYYDSICKDIDSLKKKLNHTRIETPSRSYQILTSVPQELDDCFLIVSEICEQIGKVAKIDFEKLKPNEAEKVVKDFTKIVKYINNAKVSEDEKANIILTKLLENSAKSLKKHLKSSLEIIDLKLTKNLSSQWSQKLTCLDERAYFVRKATSQADTYVFYYIDSHTQRPAERRVPFKNGHLVDANGKTSSLSQIEKELKLSKLLKDEETDVKSSKYVTIYNKIEKITDGLIEKRWINNQNGQRSYILCPTVKPLTSFFTKHYFKMLMDLSVSLDDLLKVDLTGLSAKEEKEILAALAKTAKQLIGLAVTDHEASNRNFSIILGMIRGKARELLKIQPADHIEPSEDLKKILKEKTTLHLSTFWPVRLVNENARSYMIRKAASEPDTYVLLYIDSKTKKSVELRLKLVKGVFVKKDGRQVTLKQLEAELKLSKLAREEELVSREKETPVQNKVSHAPQREKQAYPAYDRQFAKERVERAGNEEKKPESYPQFDRNFAKESFSSGEERKVESDEEEHVPCNDYNEESYEEATFFFDSGSFRQPNSFNLFEAYLEALFGHIYGTSEFRTQDYTPIGNFGGYAREQAYPRSSPFTGFEYGNFFVSPQAGLRGHNIPPQRDAREQAYYRSSPYAGSGYENYFVPPQADPRSYNIPPQSAAPTPVDPKEVLKKEFAIAAYIKFDEFIQAIKGKSALEQKKLMIKLHEDRFETNKDELSKLFNVKTREDATALLRLAVAYVRKDQPQANKVHEETRQSLKPYFDQIFG